MTSWKRAGALAAALLLMGSAHAAAQDTWATGWVGGMLDPGRVVDDESDATWAFGTGFGLGLGLHRELGRSFLVGVDGNLFRLPYEVRPHTATADTLSGDGSIVSLLASARLRTGGAAVFGTYLTGGVGTLMYNLPGLDRWDSDLALLAGAGIQYQPQAQLGLFIEWGRFWTFHQREGVDSGMTRHSNLRVGARYGW